MGNGEGDIAIYYLDEPVFDKETGLPAGIVKEKFHTLIEFEKQPKANS